MVQCGVNKRPATGKSKNVAPNQVVRLVTNGSFEQIFELRPLIDRTFDRLDFRSAENLTEQR